jgi:hypothetical protein
MKFREILWRSNLIKYRTNWETQEKNGEKNPMGIRMSVGTENIKQLMLVLDRLEQITQEVLEIS